MIFGEDGLPAHVIVDIDSRAYAWLQQDEDGMWSVTEGGPSYLWREVEKTVTVWREMGSPEQRMFTISITPEAQIVQLEAAGQHMQWMLPIT
jgi:hypothetical protein